MSARSSAPLLESDAQCRDCSSAAARPCSWVRRQAGMMPAPLQQVISHATLLRAVAPETRPVRPAGLDAAPPTIERCVQRVSQLYEQGVDLIHIRTYLRRWLRWARSGLRAPGEGLSERALELVVRSLSRLDLLRCPLLPLLPAVAGPAVGNEGDGTEHRCDGG